MANEIGNLKFTIEANANSAKTAVEDLKVGVEGLKSSITEISGMSSQLVLVTESLKSLSNSASNVSRLINSFTNLKEAMSQLNDVSFSVLTYKVTELRTALEPLESFGTNSVGAVLNSLRSVNSATQSLNSINLEDFNTQLEKVGNAMGHLNGVGNSNIGSTLRNVAKAPGIVDSLDDIKGMKSAFQGVANAIKPLTELSKSNLAPYVTQLSKIPEVVKSIDNATLERFKKICQELSKSLLPLGQSLNRVGQTFSRLPQNIQKANNSMQSLSKSSSSSGGGIFSGKLGNLTRVIGQFWILKNAINTVGGGIRSLFDNSAGFTEAMNLFSVSMGGATESAMEFADKVQNLMGIDKKEWMEYQGGLNMLITGFDVASDKAQIMSQNLTQLAYDYSSLINVDPSESFSKIQSAMSGQIKGLKEYGNNVSTAMVKQTGLRYGLSGSVSNWDNAAQATMRYVTIMENASKTGVYNDLARTITTPMNAMRIFSQQCNQMIRAIGNIASVIIAKAIPYLQLLAQVVTRVASAIASVLGFKLPKIDYSGLTNAGTSAKDLNSGLNNTGKSGGAAAKGLKKANKEAKKLKNTTQSWDELHVMPEKDDTDNTGASSPSGGGGGAGAGGLQSLGDIDLPQYDFFKGLQNDANKRIDAIMKRLKELFKPISQSWSQYGSRVLDSFSNKYKAIGKLVSTVGKSIEKVWQNGTGKQTVDTILRIIIKINDTITSWATSFTKAWKQGNVGTKIIQNIWNIVNECLGFFEDIVDAVKDVVDYIDWSPLLKTAEGVLSTISTIVSGLRKTFKATWDKGGKYFARGVIDLANSFLDLINGVNRYFVKPFIKIFGSLYKLTIQPFITLAIGGIGSLLSVLGKIISTVSKCKVVMTALGIAISSLVIANVTAKFLAFYKLCGSMTTVVKVLFKYFQGYTKIGRLMTSVFSSVTSSGALLQKGLTTLMTPLTNVVNGITGTTTATSLMKTAIGGLTSPLGLAITGFTALAGALVYYCYQTNNAKLKISDCSKSIQTQYEAIKKYRQESTEGVKEASNSIVEANAKITLFDSMKSKLDGLTDKNGFVKNMSEAKTYIKQINDIIPGTVKLTKDGKVQWNKTAKEIKKAKDNIKAAAIEQAKMSLYQKSIEAQYKIQVEYNKQQSQHKKIIKDVEKEYETYVSQCKKMGQEVRLTKDEYIKSNQKVQEHKLLMDKTKKALEDTSKSYENIDKTVNQMAKGIESAGKKTSKSATKVGKTVGKNISDGIASAENQKNAQTQTSKLLNNAQKTSNKTKVKINSTYKTDPKKDTDEHIKKRQKQADTKKVTVKSAISTNASKDTKDHVSKRQTQANKLKVTVKSAISTSATKDTKSHIASRQAVASKSIIKIASKITGDFTQQGKDAGSNFKSGLAKTLTSSSKGIANIMSQVGKNTKSVGSIYVKPYALGGFPDMGQMFIARESGPELVGNIGGRTAVVNNDQIVQAVSVGVANAIASTLGTMNSSQEIVVPVNLDGREIARQVTRNNKKLGNNYGFGY